MSNKFNVVQHILSISLPHIRHKWQFRVTDELSNYNDLVSVEMRMSRRHVRHQDGSLRQPGCGDRGTGAPTLMSTSLLTKSGYSCANIAANRHLYQHQLTQQNIDSHAVISKIQIAAYFPLHTAHFSARACISDSSLSCN